METSSTDDDLEIGSIPEQSPELDLLTAKEVADILRLNPQVVLRKLQAAEIPGYKIGKDWRVSKSRLMEWLEEHSNATLSRYNKYAFNFFAPDGHLKAIPAQRKKKVAVLEVLLKQFEHSRVYDESEVNEIIRRFHMDVCLLRREFIMEKMMSRKDGRYKRNSFYVMKFERE